MADWQWTGPIPAPRIWPREVPTVDLSISAEFRRGVMSGSETSANRYRIGIDIGGTFTDVVAIGSDGAVLRRKVLSTPPNFSVGVLNALNELSIGAWPRPEQFDSLLHATTVATNAVLEQRGAETALLTTRGFRDLLEIARMRRPQLYDTRWVKPSPLVRRRLRIELDQRITAEGSLQPPFDPEQVRVIVESLDGGVRAVAVCLVNSYLRPDEERRVADEIRSIRPELFVSASVDVSPDIGEFERLSTAVVNCYVGPVVDGYLDDLERELHAAKFSGRMLLMHSDGGFVTREGARATPVQLLESGPAAGVMAAKALAARMGIESAITFDMGGTTAKASLIEGGEPFDLENFEVGGGMTARRGVHMGAGYAVRVPCIDVAEIGAGGGSIVWVDEGGSPRVGPQSASAQPGPACYGAGGIEPTLTDAAVVLGYLDRATIGGGTQSVDRSLAWAALERIASRLHLPVAETAYGAYKIAVSNMTRVIKAVTSERGRDPRDSMLVAFGGAGPAYAGTMAIELGLRRAIIPESPGLFSAVGLLATRPLRTHVRRYDGDATDAPALTQVINEVESDLRAELLDEGLAGGNLIIERFVDMRYRGQRFDLKIRLPDGVLDRPAILGARDRFHEEHLRTYSYRRADGDLELTRVRVRATANEGISGSDYTFAALSSPKHDADHDRKPAAPRRAYFGPELGFVETQVLSRADLRKEPKPGPIIIDEMDSTILIPPGTSSCRDEFGNVVIYVA